MKFAKIVLSVLFWEVVAFGAQPQVVLNLINQYRAQGGLSSLMMTQNLYSAAWYHSKDMCERNFFSHVNPSGQDGGARLRRWEISFQNWGENIYWGSGVYESENSAVQAWLSSPPNRANILGAFDQVGIGLYQCPSNGRTFYTAVFIKTSVSTPQPEPAGLFGAIAFSPSTGDSGRSWNWRSQGEAEAAALQACTRGPRRPQDCRSGIWMRDACGAVAMGAGGRWGWSWNTSVRVARDSALRSCGGVEICYLVASVCSDGSGQ